MDIANRLKRLEQVFADNCNTRPVKIPMSWCEAGDDGRMRGPGPDETMTPSQLETWNILRQMETATIGG